MDEDTEGMQGTIYYLQQQLRQAKERITQLNSQLALTQTPDTQSVDESSIPVITELGSDTNNEAARTEERTLMPQPNGNAPHEEPQFNNESALDSTGANQLTNGRKRTQSETDGSELADSQEAREDNISEVEGLPSQKRTRTDGEEGEGEEGTVPIMENGVMESE